MAGCHCSPHPTYKQADTGNSTRITHFSALCIFNEYCTCMSSTTCIMSILKHFLLIQQLFVPYSKTIFYLKCYFPNSHSRVQRHLLYDSSGRKEKKNFQKSKKIKQQCTQHRHKGKIIEINTPL